MRSPGLLRMLDVWHGKKLGWAHSRHKEQHMLRCLGCEEPDMLKPLDKLPSVVLSFFL